MLLFLLALNLGPLLCFFLSPLGFGLCVLVVMPVFVYFITCQTCGCVNPLNAELNPICHLLALLGAHPILRVSRIRVN